MIPKSNVRQAGISSPRGIGSADTGSIGRALSSLGGELSQAGAVLENKLREVQRDDGANKALHYKAWAKAKKVELERDYKENFNLYDQTFDEFVGNTLSIEAARISDEMPAESKYGFFQQVTPYIYESKLDASAKQMQFIEDDAKINSAKALEAVSVSIRQDPTNKENEKLKADTLLNIRNNKNISVEARKELEMEYKFRLEEAEHDGMYNKYLESKGKNYAKTYLQSGLKKLRSKQDALPGEKYSQIEQRYLTAIADVDRANTQEAADSVAEWKANQGNSKQATDEYKKSVYSKINSVTDPDTRSKLLAQADTLKFIDDSLFAGIKELGPDALDKKALELKDQLLKRGSNDFVKDLQYKEVILTNIDEIVKARKNNLENNFGKTMLEDNNVAYASAVANVEQGLKYMDGLTEYAKVNYRQNELRQKVQEKRDVLESLRRQFDIKNKDMLAPEEKRYLASKFALGSAKEAVDAVSYIYDTYDQYAANAMQEMIADRSLNLPKSVSGLMLLDREFIQEATPIVLGKYEDIKSEGKVDTLKSIKQSSTYKQLTATLEASSTMQGGANIEALDGLIDAYVSHGIAKNKSPSEIKKTMDNLLENGLSPIRGGQSRMLGSMIPKQDRAIVEKFFNYKQDPKKIEGLDLSKIEPYLTQPGVSEDAQTLSTSELGVNTTGFSGAILGSTLINRFSEQYTINYNPRSRTFQMRWHDGTILSRPKKDEKGNIKQVPIELTLEEVRNGKFNF